MLVDVARGNRARDFALGNWCPSFSQSFIRVKKIAFDFNAYSGSSGCPFSHATHRRLYESEYAVRCRYEADPIANWDCNWCIGHFRNRFDFYAQTTSYLRANGVHRLDMLDNSMTAQITDIAMGDIYLDKAIYPRLDIDHRRVGRVAGGAVVADTCLALNRRCWSFDIADRLEERPEIEPHFWDPHILVLCGSLFSLKIPM